MMGKLVKLIFLVLCASLAPVVNAEFGGDVRSTNVETGPEAAASQPNVAAAPVAAVMNSLKAITKGSVETPFPSKFVHDQMAHILGSQCLFDKDSASDDTANSVFKTSQLHSVTSTKIAKVGGGLECISKMHFFPKAASGGHLQLAVSLKYKDKASRDKATLLFLGLFGAGKKVSAPFPMHLNFTLGIISGSAEVHASKVFSKVCYVEKSRNDISIPVLSEKVPVQFTCKEK
ncbi:hypothetical protein HDU97_003014 [Phlyctochytrium planicorne]|nr:hypothetical protein HDU97_003014 [Phlyctochytrium planicorne]